MRMWKNPQNFYHGQQYLNKLHIQNIVITDQIKVMQFEQYKLRTCALCSLQNTE